MKITRRQLRRLIRETVSYYERESLWALRALMGPRGLPVTHEFLQKDLESIMSDRAILGTYGIFFTVGHLSQPQFVTGPGYIIHGYIPPNHVNSNFIYPDMRFEGWEGFWNETGGNPLGYEISTNYEDWPMSQWSAIINNRTYEQAWP